MLSIFFILFALFYLLFPSELKGGISDSNVVNFYVSQHGGLCDSKLTYFTLPSNVRIVFLCKTEYSIRWLTRVMDVVTSFDQFSLNKFKEKSINKFFNSNYARDEMGDICVSSGNLSQINQFPNITLTPDASSEQVEAGKWEDGVYVKNPKESPETFQGISHVIDGIVQLPTVMSLEILSKMPCKLNMTSFLDRYDADIMGPYRAMLTDLMVEINPRDLKTDWIINKKSINSKGYTTLLKIAIDDKQKPLPFAMYDILLDDLIKYIEEQDSIPCKRKGLELLAASNFGASDTIEQRDLNMEELRKTYGSELMFKNFEKLPLVVLPKIQSLERYTGIPGEVNTIANLVNYLKTRNPTKFITIFLSACNKNKEDDPIWRAHTTPIYCYIDSLQEEDERAYDLFRNKLRSTYQLFELERLGGLLNELHFKCTMNKDCRLKYHHEEFKPYFDKIRKGEYDGVEEFIKQKNKEFFSVSHLKGLASIEIEFPSLQSTTPDTASSTSIVTSIINETKEAIAIFVTGCTIEVIQSSPLILRIIPTVIPFKISTYFFESEEKIPRSNFNNWKIIDNKGYTWTKTEEYPSITFTL